MKDLKEFAAGVLSLFTGIAVVAGCITALYAVSTRESGPIQTAAGFFAFALIASSIIYIMTGRENK